MPKIPENIRQLILSGEHSYEEIQRDYGLTLAQQRAVKAYQTRLMGKPKRKYTEKSQLPNETLLIKLGNIAIRIENDGTKVSEIVTDDEALTIKVTKE